jgi:hypothetical protein
MCFNMAGVPGIEPRAVESKSTVLPLHHTPIVWRSQRDSNPFLRRDRALYSPIYYGTIMAPRRGLEPRTFGLTVRRNYQLC